MSSGYWYWAWPVTTDVTDGDWFITHPETIYVPTKFEQQRERFRDQLARRRGRLLAMEVAEQFKGGGV